MCSLFRFAVGSAFAALLPCAAQAAPYAYITNGASETVSVIDTARNAVVTTIPVGEAPVALGLFIGPDVTVQPRNYQDLWWVPGGIESGWGVSFTHQDDVIFATWFTYDIDGAPLWLSATTPKTAPGVYSGTLFPTTGPAFNAVPFDPNAVTRTPVGTLAVTFANGNAANCAYTATLSGSAPVAQTKLIARQVFRAPGTVCR